MSEANHLLNAAGLTSGECDAKLNAMVKAMDEQAQLGEIIGRLSRTYPTLPPSTIADVVQELHARFDGARIREFIPLFVERRAHAALTELDVSYAS